MSSKNMLVVGDNAGKMEVGRNGSIIIEEEEDDKSVTENIRAHNNYNDVRISLSP